MAHPKSEQTPQPVAVPVLQPVPMMPKKGSPCPRCQQGKLDYNGVLDLECPACGYVAGGGGGCS